MIGVALGLVTANAIEWVMHKYALHGLGADRRSFWSFHWHDHHAHCRRMGFFDPDYMRPLGGWHAKTKEAVALGAGAAVVLPLFPVAPLFAGTLVYCGANYYYKHRRSHMDADWAREHLPWHYDHHMGANQNANWCVTRPWFDHVMGTRIPYVGTEKELKDRAVQAERFLRARRRAVEVYGPKARAARRASGESLPSSTMEAMRGWNEA